MLVEREIRTPVSLVLPSGRLNPDAVGFTRTPLHDTSGVGARTPWGRTKRWEYWGVVGPGFVLAATVASIDYAAVSEIFVLDRTSGREFGASAFRPFGAGVTLPPTLGDGPARARARDLEIDIEEVDGGTVLRAATRGLRFEVLAELPSGHERLGVVVPWSARRFQYTVKDVARPATGWIEIEGRRQRLENNESWAVLDHGRGVWPYDVHWNWAAASGRVGDQVVGVQLGSEWTHGTGATENALVVDGILHKNSEELTWEYDLVDPTTTWAIRGQTAELTFHPFHERRARTELGILSTRTNQLFGTFAGWMLDGTGQRVAVDGVTGWAEDVHNRW